MTSRFLDTSCPRAVAAGVAAVCVAAYMAATGTPQLVRAQDGAVESESENAEYEQLIDDALNEYQRGSWEESAALFHRAHELRPSARTLRGMGLTAYEARRYPDCIRYLTAAMKDPRHPLTAGQRDLVGKTLTRARLFVGYTELAIDPSGATVAINGQTANRDDDGSVILSVGWNEIEVSAPGYVTLTKRIHVNAGDHQQHELHLVANQAPPPIAAVDSGQDLRQAPVASPYSTWKWVAGGGALAALGAGAAMLVVQKSKAPAYARACIDTAVVEDPAGCMREETLLGKTLWTGSIIGFSVGAGLVALSAVLFALDQRADAAEHVALPACTTEATLGIACRVSF